MSTSVTSRLPGTKPLVLVTVGSDHHPFDRLVQWVDTWSAARSPSVDCLIQHGPAAPPRNAEGVDFVPHDELMRLMAAASAVIVQGGPMSIVEARQAGHLPITVPRLPHLGEVVDGHQVVFAQRWAQEGKLILAEDEATLHEQLDRVLASPDQGRVEEDPQQAQQVERAVKRVAAIATSLLQDPSYPPEVVMIGGSGRSGSTLLERCLAEVPGVLGLGETLHLWERGLMEDQLCGCGQPFSTCPFWQEVGERAFDGWQSLLPEDALEDRRRVVRTRHLPALVLGGLTPQWRLRRARMLRRLNALYRSVAEVGRSRLIVDSSKHPAYAYLLRAASLRLRCVLVVRDPRGVAYSWSKRVERPEVIGTSRLMPRYSAGRVAAEWSTYRLVFHALRLLGVPVLLVRYEDFVTAPRQVTADILKFCGIEPTPAELAHLGEDGAQLGTHHTVAGNPMRFRTGAVPIRADEEWRTRLPRRTRLLVETLTMPWRFWDMLPGPRTSSSRQPAGAR